MPYLSGSQSAIHIPPERLSNTGSLTTTCHRHGARGGRRRRRPGTGARRGHEIRTDTARLTHGIALGVLLRPISLGTFGRTLSGSVRGSLIRARHVDTGCLTADVAVPAGSETGLLWSRRCGGLTGCGRVLGGDDGEDC